MIYLQTRFVCLRSCISVKTNSELIFPTVQSVGREAVQRTRGTQGGVEEGRPTVEVERPTFEQHRDPHLRSRRQQFRDWDTADSRRSEKRNKGPGWLSGGSEQITIVKSQNEKEHHKEKKLSWKWIQTGKLLKALPTSTKLPFEPTSQIGGWTT